MATGTGSSIVDFGSTPTEIATLVVTGQAGILAGDNVEVYFQGNDFTGDHPAESHKWIFPTFIRPSWDDIVAGTGFTITLLSQFVMTGQVKVRWVWAT